MDSNISLQIRRLIEVDKRAIELEDKKENELKQLSEDHMMKKDEIELQLKTAKEDTKRIYEELVTQAEKEAEAITEEANGKLQAIENRINQEIDGIAAEWWDKILKNVK